MLNIIDENLNLAPKTFRRLVWDKITNGVELTKKEYKYWLNFNKQPYISHYESQENGCILYWKNGEKHYYKNGKRHKEDGPAVIGADGFTAFFLNDKRYIEKVYWKIINAKHN